MSWRLYHWSESDVCGKCWKAIWFFACQAIFELGPQNSERLFFLFPFPFPLFTCILRLMKLFMVSKVSGEAVWPVCHELVKNGDIQLLVPCSWWMFYINWIIGCFNCPWSGCPREHSVAPIGCCWRFLTVVTFSAFAWPAFLDAWGTAEPHERAYFLNGEPVAANTGATPFQVGLANPSRGQVDFQEKSSQSFRIFSHGWKG